MSAESVLAFPHESIRSELKVIRKRKFLEKFLLKGFICRMRKLFRARNILEVPTNIFASKSLESKIPKKVWRGKVCEFEKRIVKKFVRVDKFPQGKVRVDESFVKKSVREIRF